MSIKPKIEENLSEISHEQILDNKGAELFSKLANYRDYLELGYTKDKALELAGLKIYDQTDKLNDLK